MRAFKPIHIASLSETMIILLMGVAGSGKTTVGLLLAQALQWDFYDADDFHPPRQYRQDAARPGTQ